MRAPWHGRRTALLALSAVGAALSIAALLPAPAYASGQALAADRQNYVSDQGVDAWSANNSAFGGGSGTQDQVDMHVGAAPQQPTYHGFVHLELDALPQSATITSLKLTLHPTDDQVRQEENVNVGVSECANATTCTREPNDAVIDAFPLKAAYPDKFDPSNPPAEDSSGPEAVGLYNSEDASWSFDLAPMVAYWQQHGNTGLAIVPNAAATNVSWQVGFYMAATTARAEYTVGGPSGGGSGAGVTLTYSGGGLPAVALPPAVAQTVGPPQVAQPASASATAPARTNPGTRTVVVTRAPAGFVPLWLLVLLVSIAAGLALLAQPASQALAAAGGLGPALAAQARLHPRMVAVAGVLLVWSTTFGVYSNTLGRTILPSNSLVAGGGSTSGSGAGGTASTSGPAAAGTPSAAAAAAAGGGGAGGAGSSGAYANSPNPPSANLFAPDQETVGLTPSQIFLCAHAALTFGPAFNIGASDLNVFWDMVDGGGGVWGRKIVYYDSNGNLQAGINVTDDGYQPSKAVVAAQQCQDEQGGDFFLLGGIGFDQIPAVRVWAEQHHVIYIHHIALQAGSDGLRYSFTMLPTLELVGQQYGQYYLSHYAGKKIGIIERNSSNWEAGSATFKQTLQQAGYGSDIVADEYVQNNQGQYAQEIADMEANGAQVVLIWENALAAEQIINQANQQSYDPYWIGFPFNLTLYTLNQTGVSAQNLEKYSGMVPWPAYTCASMRGGSEAYSPYAAEIREFEAAYAKYDPGANLCGDGGDLLFGTWEAWKQVYDLLYQCGRDCTRDKVAGLMLSGYHATVGANCPVDFRGDGHHGGFDEDVYQVQVINGSPVWVTVPPLCRRTVS